MPETLSTFTKRISAVAHRNLNIFPDVTSQQEKQHSMLIMLNNAGVGNPTCKKIRTVLASISCIRSDLDCEVFRI